LLTKIDYAKNLGVFTDYTWDPELPLFKKYNVIFGENGTGKTTISRLFHCINSGATHEYPELSFKLSSESGEVVHNKASGKKIRVFNADFVELNIGQLEGSLKPILIIGEENKALAEEIHSHQKELELREKAFGDATTRMAALDISRGKIFSSVAKVISEATSGTATRTYRKNNAETAFANLPSGELLSNDELVLHRNTLHQEQMDFIPQISEPEFRHSENFEPILIACEDLLLHAQGLCERSSVSDAILSLRETPHIAKWVEAGLGLHKELSAENCLFCTQIVPVARWEQLEQHFNHEDQSLKEQLENPSYAPQPSGHVLMTYAPLTGFSSIVS
jgi:wobble nucleotide-excising tRNase